MKIVYALAAVVAFAAPAFAQGCPAGMEQGCAPPAMEQQLHQSFPDSFPAPSASSTNDVPLNYNRADPKTEFTPLPTAGQANSPYWQPR